MRPLCHRLLSSAAALLSGEEGAAAVEWSALAALIAAFIVGSVTALGVNLETLYERAATVIGSFL